MLQKKFDPSKIQVRQVHFLPQDLDREPNEPEDLLIEPNIQTTLSQLFGQSANGGILIAAFPWQALKCAAYGSGFTVYDTKADTAPAAYSVAHQLAASTGRWHTVDILVEAQEAIIRFWLDDTQAWGDDIPLTVGYHSIAFSSSIVQIAKRGGVAGTYTLIGYQ